MNQAYRTRILINVNIGTHNTISSQHFIFYYKPAMSYYIRVEKIFHLLGIKIPIAYIGQLYFHSNLSYTSHKVCYYSKRSEQKSKSEIFHYKELVLCSLCLNMMNLEDRMLSRNLLWILDPTRLKLYSLTFKLASILNLECWKFWLIIRNLFVCWTKIDKK